MPRRRLGPLLASAVVVVAGLVGWRLVTADHPPPVTVASVPSPTASAGLCVSPTAASSSVETTAHGVDWLDPDPDGATLVWAVSDEAAGVGCRTASTHVGAVDARRLAADVDSGRPVPQGAVFHCPMDDGSWMAIYGRTAEGSQVVVVGLSGCQFLSAPGRQARFGSQQLRADLVRLAPAFARPRLTG